MNFKTTLLLLGLLIIILTASFYMGIFSPAAENKPAVVTKTVDSSKLSMLIEPALKNLTKVKLAPTGQTAYTFEKQGETWQLTQPVSAPAVGWELTDLVSGFEQAHKLDSPSLADKDAGLAPPAYKITFEEAGRSLSYLVGKNIIASESTYVKDMQQNKIFAVDQNLRAKLKKDLSAYRDKQLWELKKDQISEMEFTAADGRNFKYVKGSDEKWQILAPIKGPADRDNITSVIEALYAPRADTFADDKPSSLTPYGLAKPSWKIKVTQQQPTATKPAEKIERVLHIGGQELLKPDQVYAKLADKKWVVTLNAELIKKIIPDPTTSWRDKKILGVESKAISGIQISKGGIDVVLTKENHTWKLAGKTQADEKMAEDMKMLLASLEASSFFDQPDRSFISKSKLDYPVARVKVTADNLSKPVELTIGEVTASGLFRYVKRSGLDYAAAVSAEKIAPLLQSPLSYYEKRLMEFNVDNVKSIEVIRGKKGFTYSLQRAGNSAPWTVSSPVSAQADTAAVRDLLMALTTLEATEYVGKNNPDRYSLVNPQVLIKIVTDKNEYSLGVSKLADKVYAARPDLAEKLIARVPETFYSNATAELIDQNVFGGTSFSDIDRVEIKKPGLDAIILEKTPGGWKYPADPVFKVDGAKVEAFVTALSQLKAKQYINFDGKGAFNFSNPHLKITVSSGKESTSLVVGRESEKQNRYAQTSNRNWVFELTDQEQTKLDKSLKDFGL